MISKSARISLLVFGLLFVSLSFLPIAPAGQVKAQGFSGSDCNSYQCPDLNGFTLIDTTGDDCPNGVVEEADNFICRYESSDSSSSTHVQAAVPIPPQLRQLEIWFVRIMYSLWALSGIFFTFVLIWIGFQYMTSFGNEMALSEVIKKFRNWMIGLGLVFLSYPVLNTFFALLPLDESQSCYADLTLPGFQFFFPNACGTVVDNYASCRRECEIYFEELTAVSTYRDCIANCDSIYLND